MNGSLREEDESNKPTNNRRLLARFLGESQVLHQLDVSPEGIIRDCNAVMAASVKSPRLELIGKPVRDILTGTDANWFTTTKHSCDEPHLLNFVDVHHSPFTLKCWCDMDGDGIAVLGEPPLCRPSFEEEWLAMNNELALLNRENARKSKELAEAMAKLEKALHDQEESYWHLKKIQEVLPICMSCSKVKAGTKWSDVAEYLRQHALFLSHGYCPECAARLASEWGLPEGAMNNG